jgi:hypothetical protein
MLRIVSEFDSRYEMFLSQHSVKPSFVTRVLTHSFTLIYRTDGILPSCVAQHERGRKGDLGDHNINAERFTEKYGQMGIECRILIFFHKLRCECT